MNTMFKLDSIAIYSTRLNTLDTPNISQCMNKNYSSKHRVTSKERDEGYCWLSVKKTKKKAAPYHFEGQCDTGVILKETC